MHHTCTLHRNATVSCREQFWLYWYEPDRGEIAIEDVTIAYYHHFGPLGLTVFCTSKLDMENVQREIFEDIANADQMKAKGIIHFGGTC
tara:strand:- start:775 stop:1041 length:267 start_codon:yes stop_codon:yes gene_type:complete